MPVRSILAMVYQRAGQPQWVSIGLHHLCWRVRVFRPPQFHDTIDEMRIDIHDTVASDSILMLYTVFYFRRWTALYTWSFFSGFLSYIRENDEVY